MDCFLGWLGAFAGDIALTFGATGGVYLGGGIVRIFTGYEGDRLTPGNQGELLFVEAGVVETHRSLYGDPLRHAQVVLGEIRARG